MMEEPGANTSTHAPQLLNGERAPVLVEEATVTALGAWAGLWVQASPFALPAATTVITPFARALSMAVMGAWYVPVTCAPSDADTTQGPPVHELDEHVAAAVSRAWMNHENEPLPSQSSTRSATTVACFDAP